MNHLQAYLFGNTVEDWLISIAIFVSSLFIAKYACRVLRQAVSKWAPRAKIQIGEEPAIRACALITWAIPITGFVLGTSRLILNQHLSFWVPRIVLISSQIVFLLILVNIVPPLANMAFHRHLERVASESLQYHQQEKRSVEAMTKHVKQLASILLILVPLLTILSGIHKAPMAIWALPVLVILVKLARCYKIILKASRGLKGNVAAETTDKALAASGVSPGEDDPGPCTRETVVAFFLSLFKHQLGVPEAAPSACVPVEHKPFAGNYIYELRVQAGNHLRTRRMTIMPLGEDGGGGARCFYVIYDDHLVIKIPRTPIENLSHYIESLRKEAHIIDRLAMKECVIPRVSAILRRIRTFPDEAHLTPEEIEGRYIKWLTASPDSHKYLKIGQGFAFFMDFSKYYFLQHIIEYIHDTREKMYREVLGHSGIIWDLATLENNYGPESLPVFTAIGKVFTRYEKRIKRLLTEYDLSSSVTPYQIKEWFFTYLATGGIGNVDKALDPECISEANELIGNVIAANPEPVDHYRDAVKASVSEKQFAQTRSGMEGLTSNLLDLLARLKHKGVALRDLKPDNLLIAGDPGRYPEFLAHSDDYQIGIIDVETAVVLGTSEPGSTEEPQLGGTPHYATPSHFFRNEVLRNAFKDLARTLHLQDWHAMVVIIYRLITGEVLFDKTAQLVPGIVRTIGKSSGSVPELGDIVEKVSQMFWGSALVEFRVKMTQKAKILRSVNVVIPRMARTMLKESVLEEKHHVAEAMRKSIMSHRILGSEKNRRYLLSCSSTKITRLAKTRAHGVRDETLPSTRGKELTHLLQTLAKRKRLLEQMTKMADLLSQHDPVVSAYELLELMFRVVVRHMHRQEWKRVPPCDSGDLPQ
jgi:hypothetical protein